MQAAGHWHSFPRAPVRQCGQQFLTHRMQAPWTAPSSSKDADRQCSCPCPAALTVTGQSVHNAANQQFSLCVSAQPSPLTSAAGTYAGAAPGQAQPSSQLMMEHMQYIVRSGMTDPLPCTAGRHSWQRRLPAAARSLPAIPATQATSCRQDQWRYCLVLHEEPWTGKQAVNATTPMQRITASPCWWDLFSAKCKALIRLPCSSVHTNPGTAQLE